ncbi:MULTISPECIES: hypothetical protein [unclassified Bradyrhizobium]|uniref:hypothetical protein n=1 Tax=unclassified Bradyrhizobium TaxID=2631580 RepID=UPI00185AFF5A|nr:hypothetical protein [Bradyrhizobium sp. CIR3A]MBB4360727.1 hypothetical protein [Bradyrhizobium sp. CIR18]MBB4393657.1 hypothetical protein [Bradyrhizobium sp. ERR14]MBB4429639.1 hypothetical protein [Bradyrhizobium sp. CIR48]
MFPEHHAFLGELPLFQAVERLHRAAPDKKLVIEVKQAVDAQDQRLKAVKANTVACGASRSRAPSNSRNDGPEKLLFTAIGTSACCLPKPRAEMTCRELSH